MSIVNIPWDRYPDIQKGIVPLTQQERNDGWHLCPDRGGLLINSHDKDCACVAVTRE